MEAATMFKIAIERSDIPPKAVAMEIDCSVDAVYKAANGERRIPRNARQKLAGLHLLAGLAVALEDTGYQRIFTYDDRDRNIQCLIQRVMKEDSEADEALKSVVWRLLDKTKPEDLSPEDVVTLRQVAVEICDRIRSDLNLLIEFDSKYRLGLIDCIQTKEKHDTHRQVECRA